MPRYIPQAAEDKGLSKREPGTALMSSISALCTGQGSVAQEGWLQLSCRPSWTGTAETKLSGLGCALSSPGTASCNSSRKAQEFHLRGARQHQAAAYQQLISSRRGRSGDPCCPCQPGDIPTGLRWVPQLLRLLLPRPCHSQEGEL